MSKKHWALHQDLVLEERLKKRDETIRHPRPLSHEELRRKKRRVELRHQAKFRMREAQEKFKDPQTTQTKLFGGEENSK